MWSIQIWFTKYKFNLGISLERWNDGDEWRIYFLFWEINIHKKEIY